MRRLLALFCLLSMCASPAAAEEATLKGLGFGIGVGVRWNINDPDLVDDAIVDANGFVRVTKRVNTAAGFMLETHVLPWSGKSYGAGPFVVVQAGTDELIKAAGLGLMVAWKRDNSGKAFGLGIGYLSLPSAKVLGDEFKENSPAPLGADGKPLPVRFQDRDKGSVVGLLSFFF